MNIEEQLRERIEAFQSIQLAENHLNQLYKRIGEAYHQLEETERLLEKEHKDITALEGFSINRLFREILGDKEEQLEIQRQEYLQTVLHFREINNMIRLLEFERDILEEKVRRRLDLENEIERLSLQREREIIDRNQSEKKLIRELNNELREKYQIHREIYEAKKVGREARDITEEIMDLLKSTVELRNWSSKRKKYDYSKEKGFVDKSIARYYQLKVRLQTFEDEMRDIYKQRELNLTSNLYQFQNFTRTYYDYLINDWIVRERIYNTLTMLESLKDGITRTLRSLDVEDIKVKKLIEEIDARKKQILIGEIEEKDAD